MNCSADIESNALKRIAALLFALADLAESAAGRSWPVRLLVLSILYRAEEAAHAFVTAAGATNLKSSPPPCAAPAPRRDGPIDAMRLALSLRVMALAVHAMSASRSRGWSDGDAGDVIAGAQAAGLARPLSAGLSRQTAAWLDRAVARAASSGWPDTS